MPRRSNNTRRFNRADRIFSRGLPAMRLCTRYVRANVLCVTSRDSDSYKRYTRFGNSCDLAPPSDRELNKFHSEAQRFDDQETELITKLTHIRR